MVRVRSGFGRYLCALSAYIVVALAFAWPLPIHLTTHLPGSIDGDTSIYV